MPWSLTISSGPAVEPITTDEAREHLRISHTSENSLIDAYITAARLYVEAFTKRQLVTATWLLKLDRFPSREIVVPLPPLSSVTSVAYVDENGDAQTWDSSLYQVDTNSEPGRIKPIEGETFPSTQSGTYATVTVTFVAGYGLAPAVPERFKQAIKLMVAHWFEFREPVIDGRVMKVPMSVAALLNQDRMWRF
ncbi:hypothetical protein LCGC14_0863950 [marine sediment metagenome]|uniref:Phage gp6-like head-tail connector protein n=1 Tax=marine sediment metagenome TaxID=412755 RepID=A0A0F9RR90_9ZZZZ